MTEFALSPDKLKIEVKNDSLVTYEFGGKVAKHHFCKKCGIYTFHQTRRQPGHYRINIGCLEGVDSTSIPFTIFDGASL